MWLVTFLEDCSNFPYTLKFQFVKNLQISRMLAAKTSLAARVDALGEDADTAMGIENRAKLEMRLKSLEENQVWISTWVCRFISLSFKVWKAKNSDAID